MKCSTESSKARLKPRRPPSPVSPQFTCGAERQWRRETCGPEHRFLAGRYFQEQNAPEILFAYPENGRRAEGIPVMGMPSRNDGVPALRGLCCLEHVTSERIFRPGPVLRPRLHTRSRSVAPQVNCGNPEERDGAMPPAAGAKRVADAARARRGQAENCGPRLFRRTPLHTRCARTSGGPMYPRPAA